MYMGAQKCTINASTQPKVSHDDSEPGSAPNATKKLTAYYNVVHGFKKPFSKYDKKTNRCEHRNRMRLKPVVKTYPTFVRKRPMVMETFCVTVNVRRSKCFFVKNSQLLSGLWLIAIQYGKLCTYVDIYWKVENCN
uniref:Uncharacterized protein n=1 Tax=Glossina palpalis gambiensis TaxID=67801 RepID=A0A1B0ANE3_9MUSC